MANRFGKGIVGGDNDRENVRKKCMWVCNIMSPNKYILFPRYIWSSSTVPENTEVLKVKWVFCHVNERLFGPPPMGRG